MCRLSLRFIQLAESAACGPAEHLWLAKELAKLLGEACTRLLLDPSSTQEGRGRSPLVRRPGGRDPPSDSQEGSRQRDRSPSPGGPSSGHRGDTRRPRGHSPPSQEEGWKPSLRSRRGGQETVISASRAGVDRDYLSQARAKGPEKESRRSQIDLKGTATSKSKASRGGEAVAREEERRERRDRAPVTPPSPPHWSRRQEGSSKGKGKGKWKASKGKAEIEDGAKRKKKNKGLKRGVWWEGYLQSRATRKAQKTGEEVAVEEESEAVEEVEAVGESSGAELALSERLARWSDAPEEAGS